MNKKILLLCSLSTMVLASIYLECAEKKALVGFHTDQGTKSYQEDRCHIGENLFFVADGHGGSAAAVEVTDRFPKVFTECLKTSATKKEAFESAVKKIDGDLFSDYEERIFRDSGTTLAAAYVDERGVHIAWSGDSRVICGSKNKITASTQDHNLKLEREVDRIRKAQGKIHRDVRQADGCIGPWRINGSMPTRKIGGFRGRGELGSQILKKAAGMKFEYRKYSGESSEFIAMPVEGDLELCPKSNQIISDPDYITIERGEEDHFLIVATDGLWDVMSNEYAMELVEKLAEQGDDVNGIAVALVNDALARGSEDNITAIVVDLRR